MWTKSLLSADSCKLDKGAEVEGWIKPFLAALAEPHGGQCYEVESHRQGDCKQQYLDNLSIFKFPTCTKCCQGHTCSLGGHEPASKSHT